MQLDHKTLIAALPSETRRGLCRQSDGPGIVRITVHLGLILSLGTAIAAGIPGWPLLLLPQGIFLVFLFTPLHETIHETAFKTRWKNKAVAMVTGLVVLLGPEHFRYFHFSHHRHTHDPDNDPELEGPKPRTTWDYLWNLSGLLDWRWRVAALFRNAVRENQDPYVPPRTRPRIMREARLMLVIYAALLVLAGPILLWVWVIPALLGAPFLRAYLLAEHHLCPHVADMLSNTRTTFTNRLVRWVAWNMPYHTEHHAYPAVPFHQLPAFHAITKDHLRETERGYIRFNARVVAGLGSGEKVAHAP